MISILLALLAPMALAVFIAGMEQLETAVVRSEH